MLVFFNTEISAREAEANLLSATAAAGNGHWSFIFDQRILAPIISRVLPKKSILHTKSIHPEVSMVGLYKRVKEKGSFLTALDNETPLFQKNYDYSGFITERFSEETVSLVDKIFTWGQTDFDLLRLAFPDQQGKFVLGGAARVDLWRHGLSPFSKKIKRWERDPYVLISSNLSINSHYRHWEVLEGAARAGIITRVPDYSDRYFEELAKSALMHGNYVKLVERLSTTFPDIHWIVRPHPTEDDDAWLSLLPNRENVHVIRDGSISAWIKSAIIVIQNQCTSGVEAWLAGVPSISYRPRSSPLEAKRDESWPGVLCEDESDVETVCREIFQARQSGQEWKLSTHESWLQEKVHLSDQLHARIQLRHWEEFHKESSSRLAKFFAVISFFTVGWAATIRNRFLSIVRKMTGSTLYSLPKYRAMDFRQANRKVQRFASVLNLRRQVRAIQLFPGGFLVFPLKRGPG